MPIKYKCSKYQDKSYTHLFIPVAVETICVWGPEAPNTNGFFRFFDEKHMNAKSLQWNGWESAL